MLPMTDFAHRLLAWYDQNARELPWRVSPSDRARGVRPDPYRVWLSEIMLQQTTIPHGMRYFLRFVELWPTVDALASADRDDIMHEWAGLGYYSRARNLHACAEQVVERGGFPDTAKALQKLPGIGPYTAGAIASIAFDEPVAAVDGNVERVLSRFLAREEPLPQIKSDLKNEASKRVPEQRAGDFAQAFMDLGATVCTPRRPDCPSCPLKADCRAFALGKVEQFPVKPPKKAKPMRHGWAYIIHDGKAFGVERRPEKGLLAGMTGLPTTDWRVVDDEPSGPDLIDVEGRYIGRVEHVFTHFRLFLDVVEIQRDDVPGDLKIDIGQSTNSGLPSVFAKAIALWRN